MIKERWSKLSTERGGRGISRPAKRYLYEKEEEIGVKNPKGAVEGNLV